MKEQEIKEALDEALRVSKLIRICLTANINGISFGISPYGTTEIGLENYYKSLRLGLNYSYNVK